MRRLSYFLISIPERINFILVKDGVGISGLDFGQNLVIIVYSPLQICSKGCVWDSNSIRRYSDEQL